MTHRQSREFREPLRILIVEDNTFLSNLFGKAFEKAHIVYNAHTAAEGWEMFHNYNPNIIFMDINLPDTSGHIMAKQIKELYPKSYVVMVTSSTDREDVVTARNNNTDGYIVKPFNKKKITDFIDRYRQAQVDGYA